MTADVSPGSDVTNQSRRIVPDGTRKCNDPISISLWSAENAVNIETMTFAGRLTLIYAAAVNEMAEAIGRGGRPTCPVVNSRPVRGSRIGLEQPAPIQAVR
jgi:hypothetical protein